MQSLCLDVGAACIKYGRMDGQGNLLEHGEIPARAREGAEKLFARLSTLISRQTEGTSCISLCTKGHIDPLTGSIVLATNDIPGWTGFPLGQRLQERFDLPVYVLNDTVALALGEAHFGCMQEGHDFLCVNYGSGVGGVCVRNGQIQEPCLLRSPDMGHIILHPEGRRCSCGRQGCYEAYASAHALTRLAASHLRRRTITGREFFGMLAEGNSVAQTCLDLWAHEVSLGLANLIYVTAPEYVVLGGGIMQQPMVVDRVRAGLKRLLPSLLLPVQVRAAALGNLAGLYGCYVFADQKTRFQQKFPG